MRPDEITPTQLPLLQITHCSSCTEYGKPHPLQNLLHFCAPWSLPGLKPGQQPAHHPASPLYALCILTHLLGSWLSNVVLLVALGVEPAVAAVAFSHSRVVAVSAFVAAAAEQPASSS